MRAAIYIRVSTEEQAKEGYSISGQKKRLKAFCIAQDWEVAGLYADEGISAKDMNRPQLQQMIKDIKAGKIDCVLVYRLDRLTRSVLDLYKLLEIFEKHDCKFKSATEVYDTTTAMGRMFITIVAALAQWERENMGERISFGYAEKVRQGKYALNFRPIGYDLNLKTGKLTIKEDEAKVVRLIYSLYLQGLGANRVARHLNEQNITTKAGNKWTDITIMDILKNPLYTGAIRWQDFVVENTHEAIIYKESFELVQTTIESRKSKEPRSVSSGYIFSGKLKCRNCGYPMVGYYTYGKLASGEKVKYKQYRCMRKKTGECKGHRSVSERHLEAAFIDYLGRVDFSEAIQQAAATSEQIVNKEQPTSEIDEAALQKELDKLDRRKKKWQYAWSDDLMTYEDFKKRMDETNKEEQAIKAQLESKSIPEDNTAFNRDEIIAALKNIRKNWSALEPLEKKNLVNSIIEQVHIGYEGKQLYIESIDFY
ncbi:recombinase family protein [Bacillus canaveralius]|uniref:Recombinase family protein n=1 Tax=Bacillus canaveralius TaxID=1403243 RepID=A0A2N5GPI9_9BACI|nr:recombinase family protein [Bacillus canaveralius]PLR84626.1 recombinase family protein [Bacillus canaveralius]PLS00778.1 recombinase family protein [Bacillus canaveralius]